ncbi:CoA transferase [Pseudooceanicola sp. 216_PA32_1]|uniref:CoA transferase n=1 Tax=Pseudooceanicola pacificus TaxID=2676438 RepID=A0A844W4G0_9RHOB|nr:CoA transferase [Pseudooceanicola pacificus]MWB77955.1 CoA transferase [Pseudooceanicola pacificus]
MSRNTPPPLSGMRVLDFGHTVMGPCCGAILADMGADVIKIEPVGQGDPTRHLGGFGSGYFGFFARNKKSVAIDLKTRTGRDLAKRLIAGADVLVENFAPGTMERLGLDYETLHAENPRLIFASLKGFMPGPYEDRLALDEVVQMMGGLAFMTGPSGRPLRAGTSVVDIAGGMFAVIGIMAALRDRDVTGQGQKVETALYESLVYLMGQHLCYAERSETPIPPMPERVSAWAIYQIFQTADHKPVFLGLTTDNHWQRFCAILGWQDFLDDPDLSTNNLRVAANGRIADRITALFAGMPQVEVLALLERAKVPFAPVRRPEDLFDDPHLGATGGLIATELPDGTVTRLPRLPIRLSDSALAEVTSPPQLGHDTIALLREAGVNEATIEKAIAEAAIQAEANTKGEV